MALTISYLVVAGGGSGHSLAGGGGGMKTDSLVLTPEEIPGWGKVSDILKLCHK